MSSNTRPQGVVRVSRKGQATIPKALREKFGIDTPGEVFIYEGDGRIVIEPVPSGTELHGIHADEHESGELLERTEVAKEAEREREAERMENLRPTGENDGEE